MNVKQVSAMLGVSSGKVYQLAAPHGPIPCTRIGARIIFDLSDVTEYKTKCRFTDYAGTRMDARPLGLHTV